MKCPCGTIKENKVLPKGNEKPLLYLVGEAAGRQEIQYNRPFVGPAGQVLRKALKETVLKHTNRVRVGNVVLCRPTNNWGNNRTPTYEEIDNCVEHVIQDITRAAPKLIVLLGKSAAYGIMKRTLPMSQLCKQTDIFTKATVWYTYHPSYIMRLKSEEAFNDYCSFWNKVTEYLICNQPFFSQV